MNPFNLCVERWFDVYTQVKGTKPTFSGVDGRHLKMILKKIDGKLVEYSIEVTAKSKTDSFESLIRHAAKMKWIKDNYTLPIINSKFDIIFADGRKPEISNTFLDKLARSVSKGK